MTIDQLIFYLTQNAKNTTDIVSQMQLLLLISELEKNGITDESEDENK